MTYGANGVRPLSLAANEYATTISSGTATSDNVRLAAASAVTAPTTINALVIANAAPFTGSTSTLTVTSGTVLVTTTSDIPAGMTLDFGGAEGNIFAPATLTVNGILTGSNGLTKSGNGFLVLNNSANNVTGTLTINRGFVDIVDPAALAGFSRHPGERSRFSDVSRPGLRRNERDRHRQQADHDLQRVLPARDGRRHSGSLRHDHRGGRSDYQWRRGRINQHHEQLHGPDTHLRRQPFDWVRLRCSATAAAWTSERSRTKEFA